MYEMYDKQINLTGTVLCRHVWKGGRQLSEDLEMTGDTSVTVEAWLIKELYITKCLSFMCI